MQDFTILVEEMRKAGLVVQVNVIYFSFKCLGQTDVINGQKKDLILKFSFSEPSLCTMGSTKTALEGPNVKLLTCPGCLWLAEIKTVQMRPSQPKLEVVTN